MRLRHRHISYGCKLLLDLCTGLSPEGIALALLLSYAIYVLDSIWFTFPTDIVDS